MSKFIDLTGQRFGRLTVIKQYGVAKSGHALWDCKCDCGNTKIISSNQLRGLTRSCGCLQREKAAQYCKDNGHKHKKEKENIGVGFERLHRSYADMKKRCENPHSKNYNNYGGRGIRVCTEWKNSFDSFKKWALKNGYADGLTLDRTNVNGNYEPSNCRWVSVKEQNNNRRNNIVVTYNGETMTLHELSERYTDISYKTIWARLNAGWDLHNAITTPVRRSINGRYIKTLSTRPS